jgi:hypothetical protein
VTPEMTMITLKTANRVENDDDTVLGSDSSIAY